MRLIDAEPLEQKLFRQADKATAKNPYENARVCAFRRAFELILNAPTIAPLPNDPLTLEQVREMDGEPVWVERNGCDPIWALVHVWGPENIIYLAGNTGGVLSLKVELDCGGKIYRRKPEEGQ